MGDLERHRPDGELRCGRQWIGEVGLSAVLVGAAFWLFCTLPMLMYSAEALRGGVEGDDQCVGALTAPSVDVYRAPGVKASDPLEGHLVLLPVAQPRAGWLTLDIDAYGGLDASRERNTWVRREAVTFDPEAVRRAVVEEQRYRAGLRQVYDTEVQVLHANRDGQQDVFLQYPVEELMVPDSFNTFLYTVQDGRPVPLIRSFRSPSKLRSIRLSDGTVVWGTSRQFWRLRCYRWRAGAFRIVWLPTLSAVPTALRAPLGDVDTGRDDVPWPFRPIVLVSLLPAVGLLTWGYWRRCAVRYAEGFRIPRAWAHRSLAVFATATLVLLILLPESPPLLPLVAPGWLAGLVAVVQDRLAVRREVLPCG